MPGPAGSDPGSVPPAGVDAEAFRLLYEALAPALHTWAEVRIRPEVRAWIDPQDVVQEVWVRAWRAWPVALEGELTFRAWIFRVAKNVLLESFRKARSPAFRAGASGTTTRLLALREVPDSVTAISRRVARDDGTQALARWILSLDEQDRALVVHCGLEGMSHAETAERLGISRDAAAKRWQRLVERLVEQRLPRDLLV